MNAQSVRILFVCAGNLFRSVVAEKAFEAGARSFSERIVRAFDVSSCGLDAEHEDTPHPECAAALESLGIFEKPCNPVRLDPSLLEEADLVVAMTRQQSHVIANNYRSHDWKCFSLLEANGALWTLIGCPEEGLPTDAGPENFPLLVAINEAEVAMHILEAVRILRGASRLETYPLEGVKMNVAELMFRFAPCFNQTSAIHDPLSGTKGDLIRCARLIEVEVKKLFFGILSLSERLLERKEDQA